MSSPSTGLSLQSDDRKPRERSAALHVRRGEFYLPAGESDQASGDSENHHEDAEPARGGGFGTGLAQRGRSSQHQLRLAARAHPVISARDRVGQGRPTREPAAVRQRYRQGKAWTAPARESTGLHLDFIRASLRKRRPDRAVSTIAHGGG